MPSEPIIHSDLMLGRPNMLGRKSERWRPPLFTVSNSRLRRFLDCLRRGFDLQAASLWRDLSLLLGACRGTVLDVGCGAQPYRALLPKNVQYIGIDTAEAKAHFGYEVPDTRYYSDNVWPVADATIDLVLATETLEHVLSPKEFLAEARRCLRPGGKLILTVPFAARWHYIPYDYWRFTPSGLKVLLEGAGFQNPQVFARGNEITVACYKILGAILPLAIGVVPIAQRLMGVLLLPFLLPVVLLAHCSLRGKGGDDCLGYTVVAENPSSNYQDSVSSLQPAHAPESAAAS